VSWHEEPGQSFKGRRNIDRRHRERRRVDRSIDRPRVDANRDRRGPDQDVVEDAAECPRAARGELDRAEGTAMPPPFDHVEREGGHGGEWQRERNSSPHRQRQERGEEQQRVGPVVEDTSAARGRPGRTRHGSVHVVGAGRNQINR